MFVWVSFIMFCLFKVCGIVWFWIGVGLVRFFFVKWLIKCLGRLSLLKCVIVFVCFKGCLCECFVLVISYVVYVFV